MRGDDRPPTRHPRVHVERDSLGRPSLSAAKGSRLKQIGTQARTRASLDAAVYLDLHAGTARDRQSVPKMLLLTCPASVRVHGARVHVT